MNRRATRQGCTQNERSGVDRELARCFVVCLRPGWRYDPRRGRFVNAGSGASHGRKGLPRYARVTPLVPELARAEPHGLDRQEEALASRVLVCSRQGADLRTLTAVNDLEWVVRAYHLARVRPALGIEQARSSPPHRDSARLTT